MPVNEMASKLEAAAFTVRKYANGVLVVPAIDSDFTVLLQLPKESIFVYSGLLFVIGF
jgi:hypothetical protein